MRLKIHAHKIKSWRGLLLLSGLMWISLSACNSPQPKSQKSSSVTKCSTVYDPQVDYFPNKVKITAAKGFTVEYHRNYKVVVEVHRVAKIEEI